MTSTTDLTVTLPLAGTILAPAPPEPTLSEWARATVAGALKGPCCSGCYRQNISGYTYLASLSTTTVAKRTIYLKKAALLTTLCDRACRQRGEKTAATVAMARYLRAGNSAGACGDPHVEWERRQKTVRDTTVYKLLHQLSWLFDRLLPQAADSSAVRSFLEYVITVATQVYTCASNRHDDYILHDMRHRLPIGERSAPTPLFTAETLLRIVSFEGKWAIPLSWIKDNFPFPWEDVFAEFIRPPSTAEQIGADAAAAALAWIAIRVPAAAVEEDLYA
jgi:hypothetical protein